MFSNLFCESTNQSFGLCKDQMLHFEGQMLLQFIKVNIPRGGLVLLFGIRCFQRKGMWLPDNCPCNLCREHVLSLGFVMLFESRRVQASVLFKYPILVLAAFSK